MGTSARAEVPIKVARSLHLQRSIVKSIPSIILSLRVALAAVPAIPVSAQGIAGDTPSKVTWGVVHTMRKEWSAQLQASFIIMTAPEVEALESQAVAQ